MERYFGCDPWTKYIHYGNDHFDPERLLTGRISSNGTLNSFYRWIKPVPNCVFWASPMDTANGWRDFAEEWDSKRDSERSFIFTLKEPDRVFRICDKKSVTFAKEHFTRDRTGVMDYYILDQEEVYLDFDKMCEAGWDGIEMSITDYPALYNLFYGWDVDSICIWNPDQIVIDGG